MTPEYKMIDNKLMIRKPYMCVKAYTDDSCAFDSCSICLKRTFCNSEGAKRRFCKRLCCGHVFHVTCVNEWLLKQTKCPLCRCEQYMYCDFLKPSSSAYKLYSVKPFHYNIYKM